MIKYCEVPSVCLFQTFSNQVVHVSFLNSFNLTWNHCYVGFTLTMKLKNGRKAKTTIPSSPVPLHVSVNKQHYHSYVCWKRYNINIKYSCYWNLPQNLKLRVIFFIWLLFLFISFSFLFCIFKNVNSLFFLIDLLGDIIPEIITPKNITHL